MPKHLNDLDLENNTLLNANLESIDRHSDVDVTTIAPTTDDGFRFNGSNYVPIKNAFSQTVDPDVNDDSAAGYVVGSKWINTTDDKVFICVDNSAGAAVWAEVSNVAGAGGTEAPDRFFFGQLMSYPNQGSLTPSEIEYIQIFFPSGVTIIEMETFIESQATGNIRLGIYSQTDPNKVYDFADSTTHPNSKVAETASTALAGGDNGTYKVIALAANYTVTSAGYHWIAIVGDATQTKYAVSDTFRNAYLPLRTEDIVSGVALPATATSLAYTGTAATTYFSAVKD